MTNERGGSLMEVMVALAVVSTALLGGLQSQLSAEAAARESRAQGTALRAAQQALDDWRVDGMPAAETSSGPSPSEETNLQWRIVRPDPRARFRWLEIEGTAASARPGTRPAVLRTVLADADPASLAALLQPAPQALMFPSGQPARPSTEPHAERPRPAPTDETAGDRPSDAFDGAPDASADCHADSGRSPAPDVDGPASDCPPAAHRPSR